MIITCYRSLCLLTSKSSHPDGPEAVVVVAGAGVVVVVSGLGPGGQGQLERSGEVGPLVHPEQLQHPS